MVFVKTKHGGGYYEPPYTPEEEAELYRRMARVSAIAEARASKRTASRNRIELPKEGSAR